MVHQESQATNRNHQEFHSKGVMVAIVGGFELSVDHVHRGIRAADVDDLWDNTYCKHVK